MGSTVEWIHQPGLRREFQFRAESLNGKKSKKIRCVGYGNKGKSMPQTSFSESLSYARSGDRDIGIPCQTLHFNDFNTTRRKFFFHQGIILRSQRIGRLSPYKTFGTAKRRRNVTAENIQIYLGL